MAQLIDLSSLTLNPQEAEEMNQVVFEKTYCKPILNEAHMIATGIQMKTQIPFFGQFGLLGKKDPGSCSVNTSTEKITPTEKYWEPELISDRLPHCQADIDQLFKLWKRSADALKTWEEIDNEQLAFLADRTTDAWANMILRVSSFGDTAADVVSSGGKLTNGTDKTFFNILDGLWKQIFTAVTATTVTNVGITENAGASYSAQLALASDRAYTMMKDMYEQADCRLFANGAMPVYQMSRSLLLNYQAYLEDKSLAFTLQRTEEGKTDKWTYRGIPIVVRPDWDRIVRTYYDNGTTYDLPHRAWLTDIRNVPIGTSDDDNFTEFDAFYDKTDKKHYIDLATYLDAKMLEEYAIIVAY